MMSLQQKSSIFLTGHHGMVGSAIYRKLDESGYKNLKLIDRAQLDLTNQSEVLDYFKSNHIDCVIVAAARVGGINANNTYPAEFIYENLVIESNIIHSAHQADVNRLLFLGSSCIYPRMAAQPIKEDFLLTGKLEPTNEPYAIAKIAGIKLCESFNRQYGRDYRSLMPTNLYGPGDNFHPTDSHVIPALISRFHNAVVNDMKEVIIWGTGTPRREFLHVDDLAAACIQIMRLEEKTYKEYTEPMLSHVNVGTGIDYSIRELAEMIAEICGFDGKIKLDTTKPDGVPRKLLDVSKINNIGWKATISLEDGLKNTYEWYLAMLDRVRK